MAFEHTGPIAYESGYGAGDAQPHHPNQKRAIWIFEGGIDPPRAHWRLVKEELRHISDYLSKVEI